MRAGRTVMWLPLLSVDLKHRTCLLFLQQKQMYAVSAENCNWSSAAMANYMQIPAKQRIESSSIKKGKGNWEGYHKQSQWLFIDWVIARKEIGVSFFLLLSAATIIEPENSPSDLNSLIQVCVY